MAHRQSNSAAPSHRHRHGDSAPPPPPIRRHLVQAQESTATITGVRIHGGVTRPAPAAAKSANGSRPALPRTGSGPTFAIELQVKGGNGRAGAFIDDKLGLRDPHQRRKFYATLLNILLQGHHADLKALWRISASGYLAISGGSPQLVASTSARIDTSSAVWTPQDSALWLIVALSGETLQLKHGDQYSFIPMDRISSDTMQDIHVLAKMANDFLTGGWPCVRVKEHEVETTQYKGGNSTLR